MEIEVYRKKLALASFVGCLAGSIVSYLWPELLGVKPILIGGLLGIAASTLTYRVPLPSWLAARYRHFEILLGTLGLVMMVVVAILVGGNWRSSLNNPSGIASLAIILVLAVKMLIRGADGTDSSGEIITNLAIALIAGLTSLLGRGLSLELRLIWGSVGVFFIASIWVASSQRRHLHPR